ncbi:cell surface protein [Pedobacter hiemivivus]|uniref:Cell surface protein n=1 Tax=Pedobacter hiemivivus TaxID=2530454 RepID=A0A4R0MCT4_9SPHI|nr:cell surface protein [Pedobacter hiemivivus]TCC84150.1 cell surface protein [Pedobacter hiemivivus]
MKIKNYLLLACLVISLLSACKKDEAIPALSIQMGVADKEITGKLSEKLSFSASSTNEVVYQQEWKLDGEVKSTGGVYEFTPLKSGIYLIEYTAFNNSDTFTFLYTIKVEAPTKPVTPESSMYVTKLFEYNPAPGQFINKAPGNLVSAEGILGKKGMVTLGAWGGYIVLGFDHTVLNVDKDDIVVYGNPMGNFAEPGIIWVMQDENNNGKPDDTWYEVAGSDFGKAGYKRNYSVTYTRPTPDTAPIPWKDSDGNTGFVATNTFHKQSYFPLWVTGSEYTLTGSILPSTGIDMTNPSYITSAPFAWGYADNTVGGDKVDISNAVDKNGKKVSLTGVDFIKIQTGIQANMGWLGELSTEVLGVADLSLLK